jgi:hypothetical protein
LPIAPYKNSKALLGERSLSLRERFREFDVVRLFVPLLILVPFCLPSIEVDTISYEKTKSAYAADTAAFSDKRAIPS